MPLIHNNKSADATITDLPDDIIEYILYWISAVDLANSRWELVSRGFRRLLLAIYSHHHRTISINGADQQFYEQFSYATNHPPMGSIRSRLQRLADTILPHICDLELEIGAFSAIISLNSVSPMMPNLQRLTLHIGYPHGVYIPELYANVGGACRFASSVISIHLIIELHDNLTDDQCTNRGSSNCYNVTSLIRWLIKLGDHPTISLTLNDWTLIAQGWLPSHTLACERHHCVFVNYVRIVIAMDVILQRLTLNDCNKVSPYMMVMHGRRRLLFMYEEYMMCRELTINYDVGSVTLPMFRKANQQLRHVCIDSSHVLYKRELLEFFHEAQRLQTITVILPPNWATRTARCAKGCFLNADYLCFKADGWRQFQQILPSARLDIVCNCHDRIS